MILHQFPDLQWLKTQAERQFENRRAWNGDLLPSPGWPTVVMNAQANNIYRDNIPGPLSLFMNVSGVSVVKAGSRVNTVRDGFFCISNAGERYTLQVDNQKTETFNIHFGEVMAEQLFAVLQSKDETLLDFSTPVCTVEFTPGLHRINPAIRNIAAVLRQQPLMTDLQQEELLALLLKHLLEEEKRIKINQSTLDGLKSATREELARRLRLATEYIYENYHNDISLDELAAAACLSRFHLLRQFKNYHQKTPHQFLNDIRIERAKELLHTSSEDVKQIAKKTGFRDPSSFSRLFHQKTGVYPTVFRDIIRN